MSEKPVDYQRAHPSLGRHGWIRLRVFKRHVEPRLPLVCAGCLAPTDRRESMTGAWHGPSVLQVAVCPGCAPYWARRVRRIEVYAMLPLLVLSLGASAVAWMTLRGSDLALAVVLILACSLVWAGSSW